MKVQADSNQVWNTRKKEIQDAPQVFDEALGIRLSYIRGVFESCDIIELQQRAEFKVDLAEDVSTRKFRGNENQNIDRRTSINHLQECFW